MTLRRLPETFIPDNAGLTFTFKLSSIRTLSRQPRWLSYGRPSLFGFVLLLSAASAHATPLSVFVSVLPLATFVEAVGGERVTARPMVLPGQSPATYDPTPKQIAALADADLYLRVGVPFEAAWMQRIQAANADMLVLDMRDGLPLRPQDRHVHGDHAHGLEAGGRESMDAHLWTNPRLVRHMAVAIRDALTRLDPDGAAFYAANQAAFDAELVALDTELAARLRGLESRRFLVYHPAWGYFADAYGLTQVPIEQDGKEPAARRLTRLIDQARSAGARVIFVQPQFDRRAAARVAREIDGRVEAVDPLARNYVANMRRVAALIATEGDGAAGLDLDLSPPAYHGSSGAENKGAPPR
ncbi:MAG: zinc ABC transporter substrate-binding protein [Thiohalocapsa sp.]